MKSMKENAMLYQSEKGELNIALSGDAMVTMRLSVFDEPRYLALVKILRDADVAISNLEMPIHNYDSPFHFKQGTYSAAHPNTAKDLKWMGIRMVSTANSHVFDFGIGGMLSSIAKLDEAEMVHAGTGMHLSDARAARYLDTRNGRVALLGVAASSSSADWGKAGEQGDQLKGRPGISSLHYHTIHTVDAESLEALRRISEKLGLERTKADRVTSGFFGDKYNADKSDLIFKTSFASSTLEDFEGVSFRQGKEFTTTTKCYKPDLDDILRWVRDARRQADWVVVSFHGHEGGFAFVDGKPQTLRETPADFIKEFAHACVDAGADVFHGHGPHILRGIEIYNGKPIFYSLGELVLQNETVRWLPVYAYHRQNLRPDQSSPADFFDARSAKDTRGMPANPRMWRSVVPVCRFSDRKLKKVELYPIDLGFKRPRPQRGRPLLAEEPVVSEVIKDLKELSKPFCAKFSEENGLWTITP
jgi:poly-gamma-glutamate capsule biosynthesis protein CapA/YwtB (metallophosphatase superfamily)